MQSGPLDYLAPGARLPRRYTTRQILKWTISVIVAIVLVVGIGLWWLVTPTVVLPRAGTASEVADIIGVPPPPQATFIKLCRYEDRMSQIRYIRFEAPPNICLAYANQVIPGFGKGCPPIDAYNRDFDAATFGDMSWFDVKDARDLVEVEKSHGHPRIYVDLNYGVFYYEYVQTD